MGIERGRAHQRVWCGEARQISTLALEGPLYFCRLQRALFVGLALWHDLDYHVDFEQSGQLRPHFTASMATTQHASQDDCLADAGINLSFGILARPFAGYAGGDSSNYPNQNPNPDDKMPIFLTCTVIGCA